MIDQMRMNQARLRADMEDSASSSSQQSKSIEASKEKPIEESYSLDDFDDVSMSGSGSKKIWSGKMKPGKIDDSGVSSNSNLTSSQLKSADRKSQKSSSAIGESSDRYESDGFDSLSKSKDQLAAVLSKKA